MRSPRHRQPRTRPGSGGSLMANPSHGSRAGCGGSRPVGARAPRAERRRAGGRIDTIRPLLKDLRQAAAQIQASQASVERRFESADGAAEQGTVAASSGSNRSGSTGVSRLASLGLARPLRTAERLHDRLEPRPRAPRSPRERPGRAGRCRRRRRRVFLVLNNTSTDETDTVLAELCDHDPHVHVLRATENLGLARAPEHAHVRPAARARRERRDPRRDGRLRRGPRSRC